MARGPKSGPKKAKVHKFTLLEILESWVTMFVHGIAPTAIRHIVLTLVFVLTMDNPMLGNILPVFLRGAPSLYLFYRLVRASRRDTYTVRVSAGIFVSMIGDLFFMEKDETSFLLAMTCYAVMHLIFVIAFRFDYFATAALATSVIVAMLWIVLLLPHLTDFYVWTAPLYVCLVCLTLWRGLSQEEPDNDWTKLCALMGVLFLLVAHFNLSLNIFGVLPPYDDLQVITVTLFSMGQLMMTISTFDHDRCSLSKYMDRSLGRK